MSDTFSLLTDFFNKQLLVWDLAFSNYEKLSFVKKRDFYIDELKISVQYNPERIRSSSANIHPQSIVNRSCFLCSENLPIVQNRLPVNDMFDLLVNPYPIFKPHFTISCKEHIPQQILTYFGQMLEISKFLEGFSVFYNGAKSGASAPDHLHFQACPYGILPIEHEWMKMKKYTRKWNECTYYIKNNFWSFFVIRSQNKKEVQNAFLSVINDLFDDDKESMLNIISSFNDDCYQVFLFPRKKHRPEHYFYENEKKLLVSPGAVDMAGLIITSRKEDFDKINIDDVSSIFQQVSLFLD